MANGASDQRLVMHNCQISSPGVLRRLLLAMDSQRMRMAISNVMTFMLKGSKERTIAVVAVLTEILISLGQDIGECSSRQVSVKSAMRACIVLCGIIDDLCDWRIERAMTALVGAVRSSQVRTVRDVYAEMLPRLCRLCPGAAIWVSHNEGWADFIDDLSIELKLNKDMLGNMSDKKGICMSSLHGQTDYVDSDDEPQLLIGHRVTVAWSGGHVYSGTVTAYHSDTNLHDVHYDDNERKSYVLSNTYSLRSVKWSLEKVSLSR